MTQLAIGRADGTGHPEWLDDFEAIAARLGREGVRMERWPAMRSLSLEPDQAEVLATYADEIARLNAEYGFQSVDVVSLTPDHPQHEALRQKFLNEHTHADFEVRFFVAGSGLFYLHLGEQVFMVRCEQGDLISVPAGTTHWFDMGAAPAFTCIRFFTTPDGWVGNFTGSDIAARFPSYDAFLALRP